MPSLHPIRPRQALLIGLAGFAAGAITGVTLRSGSAAAPWILIPGVAGCILLLVSWLAVSGLLARSNNQDQSEIRTAALWPFAAFALLPIQYAPFSYIQSSGEEGVLKPLDPFWQVAIVLAFSVCLTFALLANRFDYFQKGPLRTIARHPVITLIVIMAVWFVGASTMDILKTHYMNNLGGYNTAAFTDALRHPFTANGPIYTSLALVEGSSILGLHATFIWLIIYPLFAIWPSYEWLLIISDIALVLTAIPIYMLSRQFLKPGVSLLIVLVFLLNRLLFVQPGIGDLSEERFLPVLFVTAFYFWQSKRFLPYMVFALLCLTVREDIGLVLMLWGVLGMIKHRELKWILSPFLLGGAWLAVMTVWIMPAFNTLGAPVDRAVNRYSHLGGSYREIFINLLKPWVLLKIPFSSMRHMALWYVMIQSFGYGLPLLASPVILALPHLMEIAFLQRPGLNLFNLIPVVAILIPAMIIGLDTADRYSQVVWGKKISTIIMLMSLFSTVALSYTWFNPSYYQPRYNYDTALSILEQMPAESSAMLPDFMAVRARPTQEVRGYHQVVYQIANRGSVELEQEYIVIDLNMPTRFVDTNLHEGLAALREKVETASNYELILDKDDLRVYRRFPEPENNASADFPLMPSGESEV